MKRILLTLLAVMAFTGLSVAQDVYVAGYYHRTATNKNAAVIFKNGTVLYENYGTAVNRIATSVVKGDGGIYWANCSYTDYESEGSIMQGNAFLLDLGSNTYINDLMYGPGNGNAKIKAVGYRKTSNNGPKTACFWEGNSATPKWVLGDGTYDSEAIATCFDGTDYYTAGYQNNSSGRKIVVWKNGTLYSNPYSNWTSEIVDITWDGEDILLLLWTPGDMESGIYDVSSGQNPYNRLGYISNFHAYGMSILGQEAFVCGYANRNGSYYNEVWRLAKDWTGFYSEKITMYSNPSSVNNAYTAIDANNKGVWYGGNIGNDYGVMKSGQGLYSFSQCNGIEDLFVDDPGCEDASIRSLPFVDGFEIGNTDLDCWTNNGWVIRGDFPMGERCMEGSGNYLLITPHLFLQPRTPNSSSTVLSFKQRLGPVYSSAQLAVLISTTGTNSSDFTQIWSGSSSNSWQTTTINLEDYCGRPVYIAFRCSGCKWLIDDINITEGFTPCSAASVPYTYDFSDGFGTCWTLYDADMSATPRCWQFDSDLQCMRHLYGPTGQGQDGWLFSKRVTLPSGNHNYTLSYKTKLANAQQGGETHTVWIAVDKTGAYDPSDYTQIYVDTSPGAGGAWTTNEVDLTSYKGHTISIAFRYYAPNGGGQIWYVDDFSITEPAPTQYTITVNANNNAWGTVSGGGTYNAGATCTLHATPASGYQFDSWKKNGSVVSTNPNYSFTVTENATYTAYFSAEPVTYYTITVNASPSNGGTVTGGGTYPAGSSVTLTATPNNGYAFSQWQDGSTANPRTITVNGDATYTATFTQLNYTITTNVSPAGAGTVTGGGAYHYGEQVTLTATANSGYEFQGWSDGVTDNPRIITVTGNATYTAVFSEVGATYYNVTTSVSPAGAGTVTGGGTYEAGSVIVLTATANPGYTFNRWDDNSTQNPRTVTVNGDMSFTAIFTQNQYVITVVANPSNAGTVSGGGAYHYGEYATLTATAYNGYEFVGWSDGSNEPVHTVMVTGNATYTATFTQSGTTDYTVSAYVSPSGAGTVSGTGTFPAGATTTLTATANNGYTFSHWNDGSTTNPRTVTVNNNMSFTAYFTANQYTITVSANPSNGGTVTGGGTYTYGATAVLTATPNSGFEFLQWSDGNLNSTRYITVTQNASYTALFNSQGGTVYTLTVTGNLLLGQTFGSGTYPAGSSVEISAYPSPYARFVKWNDGNTTNPRIVIVNSNLTYTAEFVALERYTITVSSSNDAWGTAYGSGTYLEGTEVEISAIPAQGYVFTNWNDGNTQNPRTITVNGNASYTAQFAENNVTTHTLTVICNTSEGTVSGGGIYVHGTTAIIQAFPNQGYTFSKWSDENAQNPRAITVNSDMSLVAFFATGINETPMSNLKLYPNPAKSTIHIAGLEANSSVMIYNSLGELVKVVNANADQEIDVRDLGTGLYMVRCGNATLRFIKEQ